jgi:rubrerythrin
MRFNQVSDMLDQIRDFHGQLAEYYAQLSDKAGQQRVKILLDHMSGHEKDLQSSLAAYEKDASRQVMDTWVECAHCEEIIATCKQTPIAPDTSVDGVIGVALNVDRCLLHFYREAAEKADTESVREVFRNFIDMEEAELRRLALNALQAEDM